MSKRDDFITVVKRVKSALSDITDDQRKKLLTQAIQDHGLGRQEAEKILKDEGLTVNRVVNHFKELEIDLKSIERLSGDNIKKYIQSQFTTLNKKYQKDQNPRNRKKRERLEEAKKILLNPQERKKHREFIDKNGLRPKHVNLLFTFAITTSIRQLATLMEGNAEKAADILYSGNLEKCLSEPRFVYAAESVRSEFQSDKSMGMKAIVATLRGKIKLKTGGEVNTRQDLACLIDQNDQNWNEAKILLYDGFLAFWFQHTNETELAKTAKSITKDHPSNKDIGLEKFVQALNPQIGKPKPEVSQSKIDFGTMNAKDKDIIQIKIKNKGRGFLYGKVQIESSLPGLQISNTEINGRGVVSVALDASSLAARKTHKTSLVVNTNGKQLKVPISCYVDNLTQQAVQRVAISGLSMAVIALVARLIIQQFGISGWLAKTGFIGWERYWSWVEWFQWPWFEWKVLTLSAPESGVGFLLAFASLGAGIFTYWKFFLKKKV